MREDPKHMRSETNPHRHKTCQSPARPSSAKQERTAMPRAKQQGRANTQETESKTHQAITNTNSSGQRAKGNIPRGNGQGQRHLHHNHNHHRTTAATTTTTTPHHHHNHTQPKSQTEGGRCRLREGGNLCRNQGRQTETKKEREITQEQRQRRNRKGRKQTGPTTDTQRKGRAM